MTVKRQNQSISVAAALWTVIQFLGRRPLWVALSIGLLLFNITIELSQPQFLGNAVEHLRGNHGPGAFSALALTVVIFMVLVLLRTGVGLFLGPFRNLTAQRTLGDLRAAVYEALQRQSFAWHDNARTGELISRASTDIFRLQEFIFVCLLFSVDVTAGLLGTVFLLFYIRPELGFLTLAAMVPTVVAMTWFAIRLQPRWRKVHDRHSAMSTVIQENIAGVRVVKAFAREQAEITKFRTSQKAFLSELLGTVRYWAVRGPFAQFLFGLGVPLVLWVGGRRVIRSELALGELVKVIFYLLALGNRIGVIGQITSILQNAGSSAQRVCEVLKAPVALRSGTRRLTDSNTPASIRFENVTFRYSSQPSLSIEDDAPEASVTELKKVPGRLAIDSVSFAISAGETVALVGSTGGGKSTLLSLIPRFYDPTSGCVLVDDIDVRDLDLESLRRSVGMVFQETFLFSASVAENIGFGRPEVTRAEIEAAARAARAHGFIQELAQGYDTIIGERGISLSGGQRQRLAIARALLIQPRILILDDSTSAIDPGTEREIREAMAEVRRGRTTLLVAQRLSSVRLADRILVLQEGRLIEQGTHDELWASGGAYANLFQSQGSAPS